MSQCFRSLDCQIGQAARKSGCTRHDIENSERGKKKKERREKIEKERKHLAAVSYCEEEEKDNCTIGLLLTLE